MPDSGDKPDIETGADTLLSFLEEKSKWPVSRIADDLGVPEDTIKNWAQALEKSGLVEIKYSAIKGMVLEYSSEKSFEELNQGRSELQLEAEELEIEAEEVETVEEEGKMAETKKAGNVEEQARKEAEDVKDAEINQPESEEDEEDAQEEDGFSEKLEGFDSGSTEESSEEEDVNEEDGKERLKNELENLEKEKKQTHEEEKQKAKLQAGKAKIKKKSGGAESKEKLGGQKTGSQDHVGKVQKKVKEGSSGNASNHETGDGFEEHAENLKQLGKLLRDKEVENGDIYAKMDKEMDDLKYRLVQEDVDEDLRQEISSIMERLENDIENAEEPKSFLESLKDRILGVLP